MFGKAKLKIYSHIAGYARYDEENSSPLSLDDSEGVPLETVRELLQQGTETCPEERGTDESSSILNPEDTSAVSELPPVLTLCDLLNLSDEARRDLLRRSAEAELNRLAQSTFLEIEKISDNQSLFFGNAGLLIHHSDEIPDILNMQIWAVESDDDIRDTLKDIDLILDGEAFDSFLRSVGTALTLKNPALNTVVGTGSLIACLVRRKLHACENDLVGYWQTTLNRIEHYPHGIRDKRNVPDITGNILVNYTIFGVDKAANFAD